MPQRSNFNLFSAQHNATLLFTAPTESAVAATKTLANKAGPIAVALNDQAESVLNWVASYSQLTQLRCVYFERLSIDGCSLVVNGYNGADAPTQLAHALQQDDFLFAEIPSGIEHDNFQIVLTVPAQPAGEPQYLSATPPFLGGIDLGDLGFYAYEWGRGIKFMGDVDFEESASLRLPNPEPDFKEKYYEIAQVNKPEADYLFKFCRQQKGQMVLFREFDAVTEDDSILGWLSGDLSTQNTNNQSNFNIRLVAKNAR